MPLSLLFQISAVFMAFATLGYFLISQFTITMYHVMPPLLLFACFFYTKDFFIKKQRLFDKLIDGFLACYTLYLCFIMSSGLDKWYKTGEVPATVERAGYGKAMLYILAGLLAGIVLFLVAKKLEKLYDRKKLEKQREKETVLRRLQEDAQYLERVKAFKAKYGTDSYT